MLVTLTVLLLSIIFVQSYLPDEDGRLRNDCYKSFSDPIIFIKLFHYFPTGPLALKTRISYLRYSLSRGTKPKNISVEYYLARYNSTCESSNLFTTLSSDFKNMNIIILISLFSEKYFIADISYIFERGFKPGIYQLLDRNQNCAVELPILNVTENYLEPKKMLYSEFQNYINSMTIGKGDICLVTENNRAAVLSLKHALKEVNGFVIYLLGVVVGKSYNEYRFHMAFECYINEIYTNETVVFLTSENRIATKFYIGYSIYRNNSLKTLITSAIEFNNSQFKMFKELEKIPIEYKKIFLMSKINTRIIKCLGKPKRIVFYSQDQNAYWVTFSEIVTVANGVKLYSDFHPSVSNPCA